LPRERARVGAAATLGPGDELLGVAFVRAPGVLAGTGQRRHKAVDIPIRH
jgi:hypothetical protein